MKVKSFINLPVNKFLMAQLDACLLMAGKPPASEIFKDC